MNLFKFVKVDLGNFHAHRLWRSHTISGQHSIANLAEINNSLCGNVDVCHYLVVGLPFTIQNMLERLDVA